MTTLHHIITSLTTTTHLSLVALKKAALEGDALQAAKSAAVIEFAERVLAEAWRRAKEARETEALEILSEVRNERDADQS